jgi:hypothetical protein
LGRNAGALAGAAYNSPTDAGGASGLCTEFFDVIEVVLCKEQSDIIEEVFCMCSVSSV